MALIAVDYLKTPTGLVNILAILVNIADLIACGLRWTSHGDIYIQIIFSDHGWQTLVMLFLFCVLILLCGLLLFRLSAGKETAARLTKGGTIFLLLVALTLCVLATAIDIWYTIVDDKANRQMFNRIIAVMILTIILDLLLLLMIALVGMYYEQFYRVTDIHTVPGPSLSDVPRPNTNAFFRTTSSSGYVPQAPPTYQSSAHPNAHLSKAHEISPAPAASPSGVIPRIDGTQRPRNLVMASELVPAIDRVDRDKEIVRRASHGHQEHQEHHEHHGREPDVMDPVAHEAEDRAESRRSRQLIELERRLSAELDPRHHSNEIVVQPHSAPA